MNMNNIDRRALKYQAKQTFLRFMRPCALCACLLLCFSMLAQVFIVYTNGALFTFYLDVLQFPMQTGVWKADPTLMGNLLAMVGLEELGDLGGLVFALRDDVAGQVLVMPVAWRQLMKIALIQSLVFLVSVPLQYGVLTQLRQVLEGRPQPLRRLFDWYLDLRLAAKAMAVQIVLSLWRILASTLCALPGILCMLSETESLILLSPLLSLLGLAAAYALYTMLLPAQYLLARSPELSVGRAVSQGVRLLDGRRMEYFKLNLSFLPWQVLSTFLFNVPSLFVVPYVELSNYLFLDADKLLTPPVSL